MENHTENVHQKLVPEPFFSSEPLVNNPKQPIHARKIVKN